MIDLTYNSKNQKVAAFPKTERAAQLLARKGPVHGYRKFGRGDTYYGKMEKLVDLRRALKKAMPEIKLIITPLLKKAIEEQKAWFEKARQEMIHRIEHCPVDERRPFPYQQEDILKMSLTRSIINADEMGLGKSVMGAMAIPVNSAVIIICPKSMKGTWVNELRDWRTDIRATIIEGPKEFRLPELNEAVIVTANSLPKLQNEDLKNDFTIEAIFKKMVPGRTYVVVADEAHYFVQFKSARTKRFRAICQKLRAAGGYTYALTGTPLKNRPPELWCMLMNLGLADEVFGNWENFCSLMGGYQGDYGMLWSGNIDPRVGDLLAPVMIAREKKDAWAEMPAKIFQTIEISLTDRKLIKFLDRMKVALGIDDLSDEDVMKRLSNLANTDPEMAAEYATLRKELADIKLIAMMEYIESYEEQGEPLVVACMHVDPVIELGMRKGWACIHGGVSDAQRQRAIEDFQAGKLKGIAVTIQAGGTGLTLTKSSQMLFLDQSYVSTDNDQMADRIHRIGQVKCCMYKIASIDHSLERRVDTILANKRKLIKDVIGGTKSSALIRTTREDRMGDLFTAVAANEKIPTKKELAEQKATMDQNNLITAFYALSQTQMPDELQGGLADFRELQADIARKYGKGAMLTWAPGQDPADKKRHLKREICRWLIGLFRAAVDDNETVNQFLTRDRIVNCFDRLGLQALLQ